jgi:hypothetical protein
MVSSNLNAEFFVRDEFDVVLDQNQSAKFCAVVFKKNATVVHARQRRVISTH